MSNIIEMPKVGISGKVLSWEVINDDGSIDQSCYKPSDNLVLNSGISIFCNANWGAINQDPWSFFSIGTGTSEPSATDTALTSKSYAGTCEYTAYNSTTYSTDGSDPYYIYTQRGVQTPLGALNGTYGEIGFSRTSTGQLFSKHRLKDELGNPTTITVTSTQQLRLKYVVVLCLSPSTVTTGTINISGIGNINYEAKWQSTSFNYIVRLFNMIDANIRMSSVHSDFTFTNIGSSPPQPSSANNTSFTRQYVSDTPGSADIYNTSFWSVDVANNTWYGIVSPNPTNRCFMVKFETPFVKANTHTMHFTIKYTIGRS